MGWFRKRGKKPVEVPEVPAVDEDVETAVDFALPTLVRAIEDRIPHFVQQPVDRALVGARLADAYREAEWSPMPASAFAEATASLDQEAWQRLALLVDLLEEEDIWEGFAELIAGQGAAAQTMAAFVSFAKHTSLLTLEVLRHGDLRREELARRWVMRLGGGIEDEEVAESLARLDRLDYGKLLTEAERARQLAEERMAYLQKLQALEDARNPRGKW